MELRVAESLANAALAAARTAAERPVLRATRDTADAMEARRWASCVGDVRLSFETGRLVAPVELEVPDEEPGGQVPPGSW